MQYERSFTLFSHHLFAKTASKQIWPLHISDGAFLCPVHQKTPIWAEPSQLCCLSSLLYHSSLCAVAQHLLRVFNEEPIALHGKTRLSKVTVLLQSLWKPFWFMMSQIYNQCASALQLRKMLKYSCYNFFKKQETQNYKTKPHFTH